MSWCPRASFVRPSWLMYVVSSSWPTLLSSTVAIQIPWKSYYMHITQRHLAHPFCHLGWCTVLFGHPSTPCCTTILSNTVARLSWPMYVVPSYLLTLSSGLNQCEKHITCHGARARLFLYVRNDWVSTYRPLKSQMQTTKWCVDGMGGVGLSGRLATENMWAAPQEISCRNSIWQREASERCCCTCFVLTGHCAHFQATRIKSK